MQKIKGVELRVLVMSIDIVAAYGVNRELGKDNDLLWQLGEMKTDMARFRKLTIGGVVIMGRKTFDSLGGRPLPKRDNIVLTRQESITSSGDIVVARSIDEALEKADPNFRNVKVIGGAAIYAQALPYVDRIFATEVDENFPEADVFFPGLDPNAWKKVKAEEFPKDDQNKYPFSFVEYRRTK